MRIVKVEKKERYHWRVTFERDGEQVSKSISLGNLERKVHREADYPSVFMLNVQQAAREADRDIAFRRHGAAFRDHCEFKSNFWDLLPETELVKLI